MINDEEKKKESDPDSYGKFIRKKMDTISGTPGIDPYKNRSREPGQDYDPIEWQKKFDKNR